MHVAHAAWVLRGMQEMGRVIKGKGEIEREGEEVDSIKKAYILMAFFSSVAIFVFAENNLNEKCC